MVTPTTFMKDPVTGTIINTDDSVYKHILRVRNLNKKNSESIQLTKKLNEVETELTEIKNLLHQILDGKNYGSISS
jgi:hypothetical protein